MNALWHRAIAAQKAAAEQGFDWPEIDMVIDKAREELQELAEADGSAARLEEFGDLLFVISNLARHLDIDAETALAAALEKFERRYQAVMEDATSLPPVGDPTRLDAMEARWQRAKLGESASE